MRTAPRLGSCLCAVGALTWLLAGCGGSAKHASNAASGTSSVTLTARCLTAAEAKRSMHQVKLADGSEQDSIEYGAGSVGVVFIHQSDGDLCQWDAYARKLAQRGYRTISMSYVSPYLDEVQAADKEIRAAGAKSVVLMGASMGGAIAIAAAAEMSPTPSAVVDLSSPESYGDGDAIGTVGRLAMPLFFGVGQDDTPFNDDVANLYRHATSSSHRQLVVDRGFAGHGVMLLDEPKVLGPMEKFLARYAPAKP